MSHSTRTSSRKAVRHLPFLLCQEHLEALPRSEQALYEVCIRECGCSAADCDRCRKDDE